MWLPNHRLDGKNLVFENSHFMVSQKFRQMIDVMFDVHDAAGADLAARIKVATDAAREAARTAQSLQAMVAEEHPLGPLVLETDQQTAQREVRALTAELHTLDTQVNAQQGHVAGLRQALTQTQDRLSAATVRRRNRESLLERLASLRGQYADDKRKLAFLRQAEQLFDPLHVTVCPACLSRLTASPAIVDGHCGMCGNTITGSDGAPLSLGAATAPDRPADDQTSPDEVTSSNGASPELGTEHGGVAGAGAQRSRGEYPSNSSAEGQNRAPMVVLEAELRAATKRLDELTEYWTRLDDDLRRLRADESAAARRAEEAAAAMNRAATLPAPYLAARDAVAGRLTEARLRLQTIESGLRLWARVRAAEENAARLAGHASQLRAERRTIAARPDRAAIVRKLSDRFGQVLADIGYPKLSEPYLNNDLMPSVRGLPYTAAMAVAA
jgi:predicted  nucleic acid-binding Zn-ribbon protein